MTARASSRLRNAAPPRRIGLPAVYANTPPALRRGFALHLAPVHRGDRQPRRPPWKCVPGSGDQTPRIPSAPCERDTRCLHVYAALALRNVALSFSNVTQFVTQSEIGFASHWSSATRKFLKRKDFYGSWMAERAGFEPALRFPVNTLSRRAPSTTRPPLRLGISRRPVSPRGLGRCVSLGGFRSGTRYRGRRQPTDTLSPHLSRQSNRRGAHLVDPASNAKP